MSRSSSSDYMAFNDFQKHCPECKKGEPCKKPHVYALELRKEILQKGWFTDANPDYVKGKMCLYVGETGHLPKCRASAHQFCKRKAKAWEGKKYRCYCDSEEGWKSCTKFSRGAKDKVARHNKFTLRPKLFKRIRDKDGNNLGNPIQDPGKRKEQEERLALHLRSLGYGVWYG